MTGEELWQGPSVYELSEATHGHVAIREIHPVNSKFKIF